MRRVSSGNQEEGCCTNLAKVGVVGSNPIARSKQMPDNSAQTQDFDCGCFACSSLNEPRTVPKCARRLGKERAERSRKVPATPQSHCASLRAASRARCAPIIRATAIQRRFEGSFAPTAPGTHQRPRQGLCGRGGDFAFPRVAGGSSVHLPAPCMWAPSRTDHCTLGHDAHEGPISERG